MSIMKCPICNIDLSPLDLVSRTEHVEICVENGPSILEVSESGQLIVKKNVPPNKQRKICPICDKTFTALTTHFKTCALRHDVPPDLMLSHWDKITKESKSTKEFPPELLEAFITKCTKEGRIGEQVDIARALLLSMTDHDEQRSRHLFSDESTIRGSDIASDNDNKTQQSTNKQPDVNTVLMQNAASSRSLLATRSTKAISNPVAGTSRSTTTIRPKYKIEVTDELNKQANIALRINRELAAARMKRHRQQRLSGMIDIGSSQINVDSSDVECIEIGDDDNAIAESTVQTEELNKLFHKARLKICVDSDDCRQAKCKEHDLRLIMDSFESYTGTLISSNLKEGDPGGGSASCGEDTDERREITSTAIDSEICPTTNGGPSNAPLEQSAMCPAE